MTERGRNTEPLLTTQDASDYLAERGVQIAYATLCDWRVQSPRRGPDFAKIGNRVYYKPSDIDAWIDTQFSAAKSLRGVEGS